MSGFRRVKLESHPNLARTSSEGDGIYNPKISAIGDVATTLTADNLLGGIIRGTITAARAYTLPLAADLVAATPNMDIGDAFMFIVASSGETVTMTTNTGWTLVGTQTVATATSRWFHVRKTGAATFTLTAL